MSWLQAPGTGQESDGMSDVSWFTEPPGLAASQTYGSESVPSSKPSPNVEHSQRSNVRPQPARAVSSQTTLDRLPLMNRLLIALFVGACATPPVTPAEAPAPAVEAPQAKAPSPPENAPAPGPLPPGQPLADGSPVYLVGYGIRLRLHPPFQGARMPGLLEENNPDVLFVSWWDVNAENAGKDGRSGLFNVGIVPHATPTAAETFTEVEIERDGRPTTTLRLGDSGTELRLPAGYAALGGFGSVTPGPSTPSWSLQVGDDPPIPWPDKTMFHANDPATGSPVSFERVPRKPWGPWKTDAAVTP